MGASNLVQAVANYAGQTPIDIESVYNNYICLLFIFVAPIYLISQIEKAYFPSINLLAKKHLFSLIILILYVLFIIISGIMIGLDNTVYYSFTMAQFGVLLYPLWTMEVIIIILAFLYLSIKTTEKYRLYSFLVSMGWGLNQLVNIFLQLPAFPLTDLTIIIIFILKYIGAIITAIFLSKLYALNRT